MARDGARKAARVDPLAIGEAQMWTMGHPGSPTAADFLLNEVTLAQTMAVVRLLFPSFGVVSGCVVDTDRTDASDVAAWFAELGGDAVAVEETVNHLHLYDAIRGSSPEDPLAELALAELLDIMKASWNLQLVRQFPEQEFRISATNDEFDYGPTITFCRAKRDVGAGRT